MTTALRVSSNGRLRAAKSLGFDANGRAACNDFGITNGLNFLGFLSTGFNPKERGLENQILFMNYALYSSMTVLTR